MDGRIFVSYRRDDAPGEAGRLADHLARRFGRERVFLDIDSIQAGSDFAQVLHRSLERTSVALVVIGPRWLAATGADGLRRLENATDFVRLEVASVLTRGIPVVPVLVQGARLPAPGELPDVLAGLAGRQAVTLDHAEFHDDAERLCNQLAPHVEANAGWGRRMPAWAMALVAVLVAAGVAGSYQWLRERTAAEERRSSEDAMRRAREREAGTLVQEATAQHERRQYDAALVTLGKALVIDDTFAPARVLRDEVAMAWIRDARVAEGQTFGAVLAPAFQVVDRSVAEATGTHKADLLAHQGWAAFLVGRDGDRRVDPEGRYREAIAIDPENPYANAMLGHWTLWRDDGLAAAMALFARATASGRAADAVRRLQWAAYGNERSPEAHAALLGLVDAMRRAQVRLTAEQAQTLWAPYFFALSSGRAREFQGLLTALPPDDHIAALAWAFDAYVAAEPSREDTRRFYRAVLTAQAGRVEEGLADLRALVAALANRPGSLLDAAQRELRRLEPAPTPAPPRRLRIDGA